METAAPKGEKEEEGFAALFNEFVSRAHGPFPRSSTDTRRPEKAKEGQTAESRNSGRTEKVKDGVNVVAMETESPSSIAGNDPISKINTMPSTSEGIPVAESDKGKTIATVSEEVVEKDSKDEVSEGAPADATEKESKDEAGEEDDEEERDGRNETVQQRFSMQITQSSSPVASSRGSSYQTSPSSSFSSSASITPASSPLTTFQPRLSVLSAASSKLAKSVLKIPAKPVKPVLRDRAGRKRNNSLDSEFVTDFGLKKERTKSGGPPSKFRPAEKDGPRYKHQKPKSPVTKQSTERRRPKAKVYRLGIEFVGGFKLEAMDFCQNKWYQARVVQVDDEEQQVLIHFDKWNSRYDEWIDCNSERLRPLVRQSTRKEMIPQQHPTGEFKYCEEVLARWSDCRYYPAKVLSVNRNGTYRMLFYDGIEKNVLATNMRVMPDELKAQNFFSNFNLPPTPPIRGKKRWFAKDASTPPVKPEPGPVEIPPESPILTSGTKRRLSGSVSPLAPPVAPPPKKLKIEEHIKSPKDVKPPAKQVVETPPPVADVFISPPLPQDAGPSKVVEPKPVPKPVLAPVLKPVLAPVLKPVLAPALKPVLAPVLKPVLAPAVLKPVLAPVLTPAKIEELISRNIKEPLLNDKDLGLLRDRPQKFFAPKELVIDLDHNKYKCDVKGCDKSFRKESLLEYHIKYYHATKTSTSSAASRVLNRTKKMMSGSGKHPSKVSPRKRLSAPANLVSNFQNRLVVEKGGPKKRLKSPEAVQKLQVETSLPPPSAPVRKRSRVRHQSEPVKSGSIQVRKETPAKLYVSSEKEEDISKEIAKKPPQPIIHPPTSDKALVVNKEEVEQQGVPEVKETTTSELPKGSFESEVKDGAGTEVARILPPSSTWRQTASGGNEATPEKRHEKGHRTKNLKSVLAEVRLVEEGSGGKGEEKHGRHRRKHKKNKDKKRRKKKKKEKIKKRRLKNKNRAGDEDENGSDEETETDEDEQLRLEMDRRKMHGGSRARVMFKQPNTGRMFRRKNLFRSSSVGVDDDVIKCVCKNTEEEGFMIQCEFCNCWQHSTCVGLNPTSIPKKYMCYYCQIAQGAKPHFFESEDYTWHEKGHLPRMPNLGKGTRPEERQATSLRLAANGLIADVLTIAEILHGLQHKIALLQNPDHPEAKVWARDWICKLQRKAELTALAQSDSGLSGILGGILTVGKLQYQGVTISPGSLSQNIIPASTIYQTKSGIVGAVTLSGSTLLAQSSQDNKKIGSSSVVDLTQESCLVSGTSAVAESHGSSISSATSDGVAGSSRLKTATPDSPALGIVESKSTGNDLPPHAIKNEMEKMVTGEATGSSDVGKQSTGGGSISTMGSATTASHTKVDATKEVAIQSSDGRLVEASQTTGEGKMQTGVASSDVIKSQCATVATDEARSVTPTVSKLQSDGIIVSSCSSKGKGGMKLVASNTNLTLLKPINHGKLQPIVGQNVMAPATIQSLHSSNVASTSKEILQASEIGQTLLPSDIHKISDSTKIDNREPDQKSEQIISKQGPMIISSDQLLQALKSGPTPDAANTGQSTMATFSGLAAGCSSSKLVVSESSHDKAAEMQRSAGNTDSRRSEDKQMILNMEDVIRKQMDKGITAGRSINDSRDVAGGTSKETYVGLMADKMGSPMREESSRLSSVLSSNVQSVRSEVIDQEVTGQEVINQEATVELSQAYLLRHINTLHNQLSERMSLIEMEVEKLEKMFANSASGWNAVSEDPIATRKRLRLLLWDLQKISNIVSV